MRNVSGAAMVSFFVLSGSLASAQEAAHAWSYTGDTGPANWGALKSDYEECKLGKHQSPVNIQGAKMEVLPPIEFSYQAVPLNIINNGHTIQVNIPAGSSITVGGKRYELLQFHFHHPSENELNGKKFPLELHLVHKDSEGKLAVVGVLFADGQANPVLVDLFKYIPVEQEKEVAPDGVMVDPNRLLPANHAYYSFMGSLTTPPCSEEVTWFLFRTVLTMARPEEVSFAAVYPDNARPVQPLNDRNVLMSE